MGEPESVVRVFCGYAHEDRALFQHLKEALAVLIRQEAMSVWHYGDLLPGAQWESEIERELNISDIILLLISSAFMASDYCWSKEMQWAIARHATGEARVIPILLKPTPAWETTPLGALQALPTDARPITTWSNQDEALADIVCGLRKVMKKIQGEDRYPVQEYQVNVQIYAYETFQNEKRQKDMPAQEEAFHQAEQWVEALSQIGTLQKSTEDERQKTWLLTEHQQMCRIAVRWNFGRIRDNLGNTLGVADILLASQHPALLDQLLEAKRTPYRTIQWTLLNDLDVLALGRQIHAQTGRPYFDALQVESAYHVKYRLYDSSEREIISDPITVALTSRGPSFPGEQSLPARVALIHDNPPYHGFFRVHRFFSVQKIISILRGGFPYKDIKQLIDESCTL
ncbi:MAG TPA: toll/interleukin-1 receptor domain-containing protein [Ktedonobacteraceae bacterium]|nr:toll/interleukin-1 receptor domain-containing protein [Ktedonobacteraceae bacterium]